MLNRPNRRVRARMHGGVTGKAREGLPMSIKSQFESAPVWPPSTASQSENLTWQFQMISNWVLIAVVLLSNVRMLL